MKKLFALLMAAMMVIALLPTIVSAEGDVVTIDFMIENRAEGELEGFKKTLIEPFEAEHPNIKINMIPTADLIPLRALAEDPNPQHAGTSAP